MRRRSLFAITSAIVTGLVIWWIAPRPATSDERELLRLVVASELASRACVAVFTKPDVFGGTYGFALYHPYRELRQLNDADIRTSGREVRLIANWDMEKPPLPFHPSEPSCFGSTVLQTPRIAGSLGFVNFSNRMGSGVGSYAFIRSNGGWQKLAVKWEAGGPIE